VIFNRDGKEFFSTGDLVSRDSSDRNIMAWDFDHTVVKSNQIYQVLQYFIFVILVSI
jgi:hypothetical protein